MPIFLPKNISFTPDSLKKFEPVEDDPKDFIQDPEQFKDTLPQPYRMLDKLLNVIVEDAWTVITSREAERLVEASKIKPPMYSTDIQIEVHGPCKSICSSPSGDVIFLGKPDGLAVLNAETQDTIDEWKDPKMDIVNVEAVSAEENNCLVCTIDDLGIGRLFLYSEKTLYLMFAFNEPAQPSQFQMSKPAQKPIITKCQPSSNGDYIGVCFESVQSRENWLDVFKISKEALLKELEAANNRYAKKTASPEAPEEPPEEVQEGVTEGLVEGEAVPNTARTENEEERADNFKRRSPINIPIDTRSSLARRFKRMAQVVTVAQTKSSKNQNSASSKVTSSTVSIPSIKLSGSVATPGGSPRRNRSVSGSRSSRTSSSMSFKVGSARSRKSDVDGEPHVEGKEKSPFSQKSQPDKKSARFTAPVLILKIKPQQPLAPCNFGSPFAAQSSADAQGDVLGSGLKHQLSSHHMGMKQAVFEHLREQYMKFAPTSEITYPKQPSFHFLTAGRLLPTGLDQATLQGQPTAVLVWWEDNYQVCFYPLTKQAKAPKSPRKRPDKMSPLPLTPLPPDIEFKPELVWPMSDSVEYSAVSNDHSLAAFGLRNNNLIIWDLLLGVPRKTLHLTDTGSFFKLQFLDPNIYEGVSKSSPLDKDKPYKLATNCYLLVVFDDGQNFIVTCGLNDDTPPKQTSPKLHDWEQYTIIEPLSVIPELAVTMRKNGQAFIEDMLTGEILLAIEMPPPFKMFMPWQPVFALGRGGNLLYIRGHVGPQLKKETEDKDESQQINSLCVFKLRSFRTLDKYRKKSRRADNSYAVHSLMKNRVDSLIKDRISQQPERQSRMQQRWSQLKEELELIKELRGGGLKKTASRAFSESTIARTPALELQRHVGEA